MEDVNYYRRFESLEQYFAIAGRFSNECASIVNGRFYQWLHFANQPEAKVFKTRYLFTEFIARPGLDRFTYVCLN